MTRSTFAQCGAAALALAALALPATASAQSGWAPRPGADIAAADLVARPGLNRAHVDGIDFAYRPLAGPSLLQDENFYLLTLLEQLPDAFRALRTDPAMAAIAHAARARAEAASAACQAEYQARGADGKPLRQPGCSAEALRWTDAERADAIIAAGRLFDRSPAVRRLVTDHMRPSGRFQRDAALSDRALFVKAWGEAQEAIDRIIRVYALNEKPRYADIDWLLYPFDGTYYRALMALTVWDVARRSTEARAPYALALDFALALLEINRRDDAVRQLRLQESENAETFAYLAGVRWADYPYAAIVVPGWSPEIAEEPLNPGRKVALRTAAGLFRSGRAPILLVSGARLRPRGTQWTEAFEMKAYLVRDLGIPADRVLINPLSRHTTTEIRDNGRMIFRTGAPIGMKSLYISEGRYIGSKELEDRFLRDQGYLPWKLLRRIDFTMLEFVPTTMSFHREATDPMDP